MKPSSIDLILPMLQQHLGQGIAITHVDVASGGCINQTSTVTLADGRRYFLKVNNLAHLPDGDPVVYDPAVYYGDRETDLAMTELFGGFGADFYAAYNDAWALDAGYAVRKTLYNLYHILNHFNLFGSGYGERAARMTEKLLAEI